MNDEAQRVIDEGRAAYAKAVDETVNAFRLVTYNQEQCTVKLLDFLQQPTLDNQVALENATRSYRDAWIRSKS